MGEVAEPKGSSSLRVTHRNDRSMYMFALQHITKPFGTTVIKPRKVFPAGSPKLKLPSKIHRACEVRERQVEDIYIYDITSKHDKSDGKKHKIVYYFCGGAWQMPPSSEHYQLCLELAMQLPNTTVSIVSYPLAPKSPAPEAFPQLMRLYHRLLRDAQESQETVIFAGDSAGGNISLCTTMAALAEDENALCPTALMLISPAVDLTEQNTNDKSIEQHDPILSVPFINFTAETWRGKWDGSDPRVSPLFGDVGALARRGIRVHCIVGRYDVLSPKTLSFRDKCSEAGVDGEWLDWEKQMHCFPLAFAFKLPESVEAKNWMLDVLRRE